MENGNGEIVFKFDREQLKFEVSSILQFDSDRADLEKGPLPLALPEPWPKKKGKKNFGLEPILLGALSIRVESFVSTGNRTRVCRELRFLFGRRLFYH